MTTKDIKKSKAVSAGNQAQVIVKGFTANGGEQWVEVHYKGATALIEYEQLVEPRGIWRDLSRKGVTIIRRSDRTSLLGQIDDLDSFPPRMIFSRPGWCGAQFVNASGNVFAPGGVKKGAVGFVPNVMKCSRNGTHAAWQSGIAQPLIGHHIPSFFLMIPFAAPLLEIAGAMDNFGFELAGEGGKGKSTTQRIVASAVGPAMVKDRGYISTFYTTPAALEKSMRWHSDMPLIIDEANLFGSGEGGRANKAAMEKFSFEMSSGTTKARYDSPEQEGYRFIFITSANEPFNQLLGESHRDVANAATDRLMTITVPQGDAGLFGPLPAGYESYRQFTLALETAMSEQYGTAMPKYLRALVRERKKFEEGLKENIRTSINKFKREVGVNDNNGSDVRVAEAFGLVYAAGLFARHRSVLPKDFDCLGPAKHCYANFRNRVPVRQSLPERLLAIAARPQTLKIDRNELPHLTDEQKAAAGAFVRERTGEMLLLLTPEFGRQMFPDWNALKGTPDFVNMNIVDKGRRGRGYHCRIRSNSKTDWFYGFRLPERSASSGRLKRRKR